MKKEQLIAILIVISVFLYSSMFAIGLAPSISSLAVQPNNKYIVNYQVTGTDNFEVDIGCDPLLKQYIQIGKTATDNQGIKTFPLIFDFPKEIEKQGHETVSISIKEKPDHETSKGQQITGLTVVEGRIYVDIPYSGLYAEMSAQAYNANKGSEVEFAVTMKNFGQVDIADSNVKIDIYKDDAKIKTLESEKVSIPIGSAHEFIMYLTTDDLKPGIYSAKITGNYDSKKREIDTTFKIGTLDILMTGFTKEIYVNETNEFFIQIESLWNNPIEKVFADITISKDSKMIKKLQTPNYDLRPWDSQKIITYIDTQGWALGQYDIEVKLNFEGTSKTTKDQFAVIMRPEPEKPFSFYGLSATALLLVGITILLVVMNIILLINVFRKKSIESQKNAKRKR